MLADDRDRAVDVLARLRVEADVGGPGGGEVRHQAVHRAHHQVHVDRRPDAVLAQRLAHQGPDGQVGHVMVVHHVEVHEVRARGQYRVDLRPQAGDIGRQDRRSHPGTRHGGEVYPMGSLAGEARERLAVLLAGAPDDLRGQLRARRLLVPVEGLQVVAHVLLVEARGLTPSR